MKLERSRVTQSVCQSVKVKTWHQEPQPSQPFRARRDLPRFDQQCDCQSFRGILGLDQCVDAP